MAQLALLCVCLAACGKSQGPTPDSSPVRAEAGDIGSDYRCLAAELQLADSAIPYLALDFARRRLEIRLAGVVVWDQPLSVADSRAGSSTDFVSEYRASGGQVLRFLTGKELIEARERFPDSLLAIVTRALEVPPELLQRDLPGRFRLHWGERLSLEVRTEMQTDGRPFLRRLVSAVRDNAARARGRTMLVVNMPAEKALTLYRAAHAGMPTLLVLNPPPPSPQTKAAVSPTGGRERSPRSKPAPK